MIKSEEGYMDPTYAGAYKTIRQEEKRKQDEADAARMETAIHQAKAITFYRLEDGKAVLTDSGDENE